MRVNNFVPSLVIVSGLSNGSFSYILAALKVTGLAAGLEYRPDVRSKGGPLCQCLGRGGGLIHGGAGFRYRVWLRAITCFKTSDENQRQHQHAFWHSCMLLP